MNPITFTFTLHNHQPLGNLDWVMEEAYQKAYLPFIQTLESHPRMKVGLHNTGILLEWFGEHHPEYLELLRGLVTKGQVEVLTGGYYEPILPSIPDADKIGQIRKLSARIEKLFGVRPRGMWVAERVWEPGLAKPLAEAGVEYVFLDDSHFKRAGMREDELVTHFVTEEQGRSICVVPINQRLRHAIPFEEPKIPIQILRDAADSGPGKWLAFADDGEKLGSWPKTYESVYGEKWLERFSEAIAKNSWIEMKLPSDAMDQTKPGGIVYLPAASYSEMLEWSGGFWRNFLRRYPESNWMHKRMQRLSLSLPADGEARDEVWKSQCNCPYWHGVFGGLYLPHLRRETYTHLVKAEAATIPATAIVSGHSCPETAELPETPCARFGTKVSRNKALREDLDFDGREEIIARSEAQSLYFKPSEGGALVEWDSFSHALNLINTLARRPEAYHAELLKKLEVESIPYDWYSRRCYIDHFLRDGTTLEDFAACRYGEQGDFVRGEYAAETDPLRFTRDGRVWIGSRQCRVRISKRFELVEGGFTAFYELTNGENFPLDLWFGIELNLSLSAGNAEGRFYRIPVGGKKGDPLDALAEHHDSRSVELVDEWLGVSVAVEIDQTASFWTFPIETLSQSESGADRIYQSSALLPNWRVRMAPGASWSVSLQNTLRQL